MELEIDNNICSVVWLSCFNSMNWYNYDYEDEEYEDEFGDTETVDTLNKPLLGVSYTPDSFKEFKEKVKSLCQDWDSERSYKHENDGYNDSIPRLAFVMASTSHIQTVAESHLKQLGFQQIGPQEKLKHSGSKLSIWIMPIPEFMKAINYNQ